MPGVTREVQVRRVVLQAQRQRLGQPAGGIRDTEQDIRDRATAGLATEPGLDHGLRMVLPTIQPHGRTVRQYDDQARVHLRQPRHQRELRGR
jgi:hypothetical protein